MNKTRQVTRIAMAAGLMALVSAGCDQQSQDNLKEQANQASEKAGQVASDAMAQAKEGWENLQTQYAPKIDELSGKLATLKTEAAKFKDTQLDGYITQLDGKVNEIKSKLGGTFSAENLQALKDNVGKWMEEAKALYDKAAARLAELTSGAAPSGG
jgi:hypothetical protein